MNILNDTFLLAKLEEYLNSSDIFKLDNINIIGYTDLLLTPVRELIIKISFHPDITNDILQQIYFEADLEEEEFALVYHKENIFRFFNFSYGWSNGYNELGYIKPTLIINNSDADAKFISIDCDDFYLIDLISIFLSPDPYELFKSEFLHNNNANIFPRN